MFFNNPRTNVSKNSFTSDQKRISKVDCHQDVRCFIDGLVQAYFTILLRVFLCSCLRIPSEGVKYDYDREYFAIIIYYTVYLPKSLALNANTDTFLWHSLLKMHFLFDPIIFSNEYRINQQYA